MTFQGRKIVEFICQETPEDKQKRIDRMLKIGNHNRIAIIATDTVTKKKYIYSSMTEAGKALKTDPSQISKACKSTLVTTNKGKYTWKKIKETL